MCPNGSNSSLSLSYSMSASLSTRPPTTTLVDFLRVSCVCSNGSTALGILICLNKGVNLPGSGSRSVLLGLGVHNLDPLENPTVAFEWLVAL